MLIAPTGSYAGQRLLNVGENRWRGTLSLGWNRALGNKFTLDATGELAWYSDNDAPRGGKRLTQAMSHALTGYLSYHPSQRLRLFVGGQYNGGGDLALDGVAQGVYRPVRAYLGANWTLDIQNYLNLRLSSDLQADNGFRREGEVALRYVRLF